MDRNKEGNRTGDPHLSFGVFVVVYLGLVAAGIALPLMAEWLWGLDGDKGVLAYITILFALGAARTPRLLFQVIRSTGWFALIESDRFMQVLLGLLALIAAGGALS